MKRYLDPTLSPRQRANDLLGRMSIDEKMAQVTCYFVPDFTMDPADLPRTDTDYAYGAGQISCLTMRDLETLDQVTTMQRAIQQRFMELSPHHIPAIFHMEGICGAYSPGATSFPSGISRGAAWDPELERSIGDVVGRQERAIGISQTFAPVLDISRDSRMGRQGETYGEDPTLASALGSAFTDGVQSSRPDGLTTEAVAKHFTGFHAALGGIHGANVELSDLELREQYAKPFQAAISEAHLRGIMPCYASIRNEPASGSKRLLTALLRDEMGFDGLVVSDYGAITNIHTVQKVTESLTEAGLRAMEAGMDQELHVRSAFNNELAEWFRSGKADIAILDRAVHRVLEAKFRMGLFEHPFALQGDELMSEFFHDGDADVTLRAALESMTLLKNDGTLPIADGIRTIAVIGPHAENARYLFGGYTHLSMAEGAVAAMTSMAGITTAEDSGAGTFETLPGTPIQRSEGGRFDAILHRLHPKATTLADELRRLLPGITVITAHGYDHSGTDESGFDEALQAAAQADLVIATVGGKHATSSIASMGEGVDATDINLSLAQERFIELLGETGKSMVLVHMNGRAISSDAADRYANAILEAWNPSESGFEAIARTLTGDYNPAGRLPVTVPYTAGQIPLYYNHPNGSAWHQGDSVGFPEYVDSPHTPRYPFGHGLSYSRFAYEDLTINDTDVRVGDVVTISVTIANVSNRDGEEVVQLYVRDRYASMTRPVMELAGFRRLPIAAGRRRRITFDLKTSQLAFLTVDRQWKIEHGTIDVFVGGSSQDLQLHGKFEILGDRIIEGKERGFYAKSVVE
ncbi:beta-glucosidase [Bifidobacterium margollesii]|uniref:Exo-alpha-(1->6)-L-arabinopyranosidase n=1 Tax=Bifidobacterium margollesii TaxID=2020964 RepID=A0A2N5JAH7_9BIFI|nr:glycoside hydrolase family 3 N-terminal domain-containing protein [Bifidobacterium margollesii]PLS31171.1 beta-glucosidase [Bifidobacterium margollesii]